MQERASDITAVVMVPNLGSTPASVNRRTGVMYVNRQIWPLLNKHQREFIKLHERAHLVLQTSDEKAVDAWAFKEYVKKGYPLSQSIYALTRVLSFTSPEHIQRANLQWERAKQYDIRKNKNHKLLKYG